MARPHAAEGLARSLKGFVFMRDGSIVGTPFHGDPNPMLGVERPADQAVG